MTKDEYEKQEANRQLEQNRLTSKIQRLGDGLINPPVGTAEGDRLQAEAIQDAEKLTEKGMEELKEYSAQSDEEKQPG